MAVHPKRVSIISNNYSFGTKFDMIFVNASLKTESGSLTYKSVSADSPSNKSTALFYDQSSLGKNASHKEVD